jgi:hypothetical protein
MISAIDLARQLRASGYGDAATRLPLAVAARGLPLDREDRGDTIRIEDRGDTLYAVLLPQNGVSGAPLQVCNQTHVFHYRPVGKRGGQVMLYDDVMRTRTLRCPDTLWARLEKYAMDRGVKTTEAARDILEAFLDARTQRRGAK